MLLGKRLGRRHQRALLAGLDRAQQRIERDDGLPGADLALEQALHRRRLGEIGVDLLDRPLLVGRQLERKELAIARDELARLVERGSLLLLALMAPPCEPYLEDEQLVEREPAPSALRLLQVAGPVQDRERIGSKRQPRRGLQSGRQRIGVIAGVVEGLPDEVAQLLDRHFLAGGIDGAKSAVAEAPFRS